MDVTRREFFQALAASALMVGVLPVGFPPEPSHLGVPYEILIRGPGPNSPPSDPLNEVYTIGMKWRISNEKYGDFFICNEPTPAMIRYAHFQARSGIERCLKGA